MLTQKLKAYSASPDIIEELHALFPHIKDPILSCADDATIVDGNQTKKIWILNISTPLSIKDNTRIQKWLQIRLKSEHVLVYTHKV